MEKKISISYDKDADVMYLNFGLPSKAVGEEVESGIFARFDPKTKELVGFTIINFSKKFGIEPKEVVIPFHSEGEKTRELIQEVVKKTPAVIREKKVEYKGKK